MMSSFYFADKTKKSADKNKKAKEEGEFFEDMKKTLTRLKIDIIGYAKVRLSKRSDKKKLINTHT